MRTTTLCLAIASLLGGGCVLVAPSTCGDGVKNGSESDVDCGGLCSACPDGKKCFDSLDCVNSCSAGVCATKGTHYEGGSVPPVTTTTYQIDPGVGTVVKPGTQAGFGITATAAGLNGAYRLV